VKKDIALDVVRCEPLSGLKFLLTENSESHTRERIGRGKSVQSRVREPDPGRPALWWIDRPEIHCTRHSSGTTAAGLNNH
jgi:hypothetical protein